MNRVLKIGALAALVTAVVWVLVLWHWESTSRNMTVVDIVLYLAVLPATVIGVVLGLRWAWAGATPRHEAAQAAAAKGTGSGTPEAGKPQDTRNTMVQLLGAHLACTGGESAADLLTALDENKLHPELDPELRGADGIALMCGRIASSDPEACLAELAPSLSAAKVQHPGWADEVPADHMLRALSALAEPLAKALQSLRPWAVHLGAPDPQATARAMPTNAASKRPVVRMLLGWPAHWSELEREAATDWVRGQIAAHTDVPPDRFAISAQAASSGEELWLKADQLLQTLAREQRGDLLLIAACDSDLSDVAVASLEQAQRLFSPQHHPKGLMPGEAAAALLLANADWPADPEAYQQPARLHRPALLRRDKSIEATGRVSSQVLQDCAQHALDAAGVAPADVHALVCDADQHSPRGPELFGLTLALLPQLEPSEDMRLIGSATGHTGVVAPLLVIAAAAERARLDTAPCLALCLGDAFMRMALVVRPAEPAAAA